MDGLFLEFINEITKLNEEEKNVLQNSFKIFEKQKNEYITKIGELEENVYFITDGIVRTFVIDKNGEEINFMFSFEKDFVSAFPSFMTGKPSKISLQCLEKTTLVALSQESIEMLYSKFPKLEKIGRLAMQKVYVEMIDFYLNHLTLDAEERYMKLLENNKNIIKHISVKHLSSFLGIHSSSLSRIRSKVK